MKTLKQLTAVTLALTLSFSAFGCAGSADGKNGGKNAGKDESMNGLEISGDESLSASGNIDTSEQNSGNSNKDENTPTLNGTYIPMECIYPIDYSQNIDEAIAERIEYFTNPLKDENGYIENDEAIPIKRCSLDFYGGNRFLSEVGNRIIRYSGEYEIDDGKLIFEYHCCVSGYYSHINEEDEYSTIWEPNWSAPVYVGAGEGQWQELFDERMQAWNKAGTYCCKYTTIFPSNVARVYPQINVSIPDYSYVHSEQYYVYLKPIDSFLCVDTYGFELKDDYKNGDDFEITYNYCDFLCDDPQSDYNFGKIDEATLELQLDTRYSVFYNQDYKEDKNTSIKFSNGKWEWYNANGELINNGEYLESDDYEGLISMFQTEDSLNYDPELDGYATAMIFYIDGGEIYYPMFINAGDFHDVVYIESLDNYDYEPPIQDDNSQVDDRIEIFRNANSNAKTVYTAASVYITEYWEYTEGRTAPSADTLCGNVEIWDNQMCKSLSDEVNKYLGSNNEGLYWAVYCDDTSVYGAFCYDEYNNVIGSYPSAIDPELFPEEFDIPQGGTADDSAALQELYNNAFNSLQND